MHALLPRLEVPDEINEKEKIYTTEICLLTKTNNKNDLETWIDWHLNYIGINHIHIYDNESPIDIKDIITKYNDRISYTLIKGVPHQAEIYDKHVRYISKAQYVLPIDDDEYLYSKFNINDYLLKNKLIKFAISELLFLPINKIENRKDESIFELCNGISKYDCRETHEVKCFVNTSFRHLYIDIEKYYANHTLPNGMIDWGDLKISDDTEIIDEKRNCNLNYSVLGTVHNPISLMDGKMFVCEDIDKRKTYGFLSNNLNKISDIFIGHMKVRTKNEWDWKCKVRKVVADMKSDYYDGEYEFYDDIYNNPIEKCTLFMDLYKNNINKQN